MRANFSSAVGLMTTRILSQVIVSTSTPLPPPPAQFLIVQTQYITRGNHATLQIFSLADSAAHIVEVNASQVSFKPSPMIGASSLGLPVHPIYIVNTRQTFPRSTFNVQHISTLLGVGARAILSS